MSPSAKQKERALAIIKRARKMLGGNIGLTDLLLDNMDELDSVKQARALIASLGLPLQLSEERGKFLMKKNPRHVAKKKVKRLKIKRTWRGRRLHKKEKLLKKHARRVKRMKNPTLHATRRKFVADKHINAAPGKHVCVQVNGKTIMQSRDTPEYRKMAMRYALTLKRKHRGAIIKVCAY